MKDTDRTGGKGLSSFPPTHFAYAAGLLDGEGSILCGTRSTGVPHLVVVVNNTDERVPLFFKEVFGGRIYKDPPHKGVFKSNRPCYRWVADGLGCDYSLKTMLPYLILKREQALVAFAILSTYNKTRRPLSPRQIVLRTRLAQRLKKLNHPEVSL